MTHPAYIRDKARSLRTERHLSIVEIAARLGLPKTTVYHWVRDLPLARERRSPGLAGTRAMQRKYRLIREQAYAEGVQEFDRLAMDPTFRDFVCLYMAEGSKRSRNVVAIGNSDPSIVKLAARWMREFSTKKLRYSIQFHADQDLGKLRAFWAGELGVEPGAIRLQRKSNSNHLTGRIWRSQWGVLTVWAGDTAFRARLGAWMDCLREAWV
jgi:AcrR family transcriptional regulator